jgi:predicted Fe-S protein YdhL (DUF1289 family)
MNVETKEEGLEIKSPCIRNCCLDDGDICLGCFRTVTEIKQWSLSDNNQRQTILDLADNRKSQYKNRIKY